MIHNHVWLLVHLIMKFMLIRVKMVMLSYINNTSRLNVCYIWLCYMVFIFGDLIINDYDGIHSW